MTSPQPSPQSSSSLRVGIYGGAFDPPHLAHHALAQAAVAQYELDLLHIIPIGRAWYKKRPLTPAAQRLAMAELAFADLPQVKIDARETLRSGASYTIDTLHELQLEYPGARLYLLMGQDQFEFFPQWQRSGDILQIATLLVALRSMNTLAGDSFSFKNPGTIPFLPIQMPSMLSSSTAIRQQLAHGKLVSGLVKPTVARYIAQHQLYSTSTLRTTT